MYQANQSFKMALDAMNSRQSIGMMPPAERIIGKPHNDRNCTCNDCRNIFQSEATLRMVPAVGNGPLPDRSQTNTEIAAKTVMAMKSAGIDFYNKMNPLLPSGHRMREAIRARALDNRPMLGACRIGRVPLFQEGRFYTWAEFHLTNFDAVLDTRRNRKFYDVASLERSVKSGGLFYGVAVLTDKDGNTLDFNRDVGKNGLYYQTKSQVEAAYAMAGISTGLSLNQLKEMDRKNFRGFINPAT